MEHRWSIRKAVDLEVTVETHAGTLAARARDVSLEGMYLQPPPGTALETGMLLTLSFGLDDRDAPYRIKAFVVRRDAEGSGVLFLEFAQIAFRRLEHLLYSTA